MPLWGPLSTMTKKRGLWTVNQFERTYLGIELDCFKGAKFMEKISLKPGPAEGHGVEDGKGSTDPSKDQIDDRSLRGCAQNAIVVSALTLQEHHNKRVVDIVIACLLYTSPSPRDQRGTRMPSSA